MRILAVNAGSSSLKLRVLDDANRLCEFVDLPALEGASERGALQDALEGLGTVDAVGHRIVHGGLEFTGPARIDDAVVRRLWALSDLAPLHQPPALHALDAVTAAFPEAPAVACFDTAFHTTLLPAAATYAIPPQWRRRWALRRYGFHGLSHQYAARRAAELVGRPPADLLLVSCHLGSGASLAAVAGGRSVDTTMGFTPLEGLVMATRSGSLDPGLVLWLQEHVGTPAAELASTFEHRSGLLGLAGSADMREVQSMADAGEPDAALAIDVYIHHLRAGVAAMVAAMGGLDILLFTGGVGEHSPDVRQRSGAGLGFLGVQIDPDRNRGGGGSPVGAPHPLDRVISPAGSSVVALVVESREDLEIAREVRTVLEADRHLS